MYDLQKFEAAVAGRTICLRQRSEGHCWIEEAAGVMLLYEELGEEDGGMSLEKMDGKVEESAGWCEFNASEGGELGEAFAFNL
jgi:hypothetical protein